MPPTVPSRQHPGQDPTGVTELHNGRPTRIPRHHAFQRPRNAFHRGPRLPGQDPAVEDNRELDHAERVRGWREQPAGQPTSKCPYCHQEKQARASPGWKELPRYTTFYDSDSDGENERKANHKWFQEQERQEKAGVKPTYEEDYRKEKRVRHSYNRY